MEQSKEQILDALIDNHPFQGMGNEEYKIALQAMGEYAKQEVLSELQALVEMQCHPEYLKMAIIDRISEIKNPSQL